MHRDMGEDVGEAGFALVLTLVVILALSLLTEVMTRWVSSALEGAFVNREEVDAKRQLSDAEAISLYLFLTRPRSFRGVELLTVLQLRSFRPTSPAESLPSAESHIRLDDHAYRLDDVVLRFQDARGP